MDLITIPIMFKHFCDSMTCYSQTNYVTLTDLDIFVIGINCFYGYLIARAYLKSKKANNKILGVQSR